MKEQIVHLQPMCLGKPWNNKCFEAVAHLHAPLWRSKLHGAVATCLPIMPPQHPRLHHHDFPALRSADLSGHVLLLVPPPPQQQLPRPLPGPDSTPTGMPPPPPPGGSLLDMLLARSTALRSLRVAECSLDIHDFIKCLSGLRHIRHVDMSGVGILRVSIRAIMTCYAPLVYTARVVASHHHVYDVFHIIISASMIQLSDL